MQAIYIVSNDSKSAVLYQDIGEARMVAEMYGGIVYMVYANIYYEDNADKFCKPVNHFAALIEKLK